MSETKPKAVPAAFPHAHLPLLTDDDVGATTVEGTLYRACRVGRAAGSMTEASFVAWLCNRLPVTLIDGAGNIHVDLRQGPMHRTMFTAHTDTVHRGGGVNAIRLDTTEPERTIWRADNGSCLGADDGAGVALMVHMIERGVPGLYVFFRDEESGGVGSRWLADEMPDALKGVDRCVSLDRAGYGDVITHQAGARCCSDAFAEALSLALTTEDMSMCFLPDSSGVFTDSDNLTFIVAECTNLSVGYFAQHGDGEWQDVTFLKALGTALVNVAWDELPVARDPKVQEITGLWGGTGHWDMTKGTSVPAGRELPRVYLDEATDYLVDALYSASEGDYAIVRGLVSEWVMPEDPDTARRFVDPRRMDDDTYAGSAIALERGTLTYDAVMALMEDLLIVN